MEEHLVPPVSSAGTARRMKEENRHDIREGYGITDHRYPAAAHAIKRSS
jgi:hypothetical protein